MSKMHHAANSTWSRGKKRESHPDCPVCQKRHQRTDERRARWRAVKACHQCGNPSRSRYATCTQCRARHAARNRVLRDRKRQRALEAA